MFNNHYRKFVACLTVSLCLIHVRAAAQQNTPSSVKVTVMDMAGKPMPFVNVLLKQATDSSLVKGNLSDEAGACIIENIPHGHYFLELSMMGYQTQFSPAFSIEKDTALQLGKFSLAHAARNLKEISVVSKRPFIESTAGKMLLNVENSIVSTGSSALDVLRKAPGISVDKDENLLVKGKTGVTILLDNKLTHLSGEQLTNLLKNLSSSDIAQIEIISNPSAKYDASGSTGLINIKTKKGRGYGLNGSVTGGIGYSRFFKFNGGLNLNYRSEKLNFYGSYNNQNRELYDAREIDRLVQGAPGQLFRQETYTKNHLGTQTYKAGVDYYINNNHVLGVMVNGYGKFINKDNSSETRIGDVKQEADSLLGTLGDNRNKYRNISYNFNYKGTLDSTGTTLSFDADWVRFRNTGHLRQQDSIVDLKRLVARSANAIRNATLTDITIKSLKADLSKPLGKSSRLDVGVKMSWVETENSLGYDSLKNGVYVPALSQSNQFVYQENVLAGYAQYKIEIGKTSLEAGLRLENTESNGNSVTLKKEVKRSYLDVFPSLLIDHTFNASHKLSLGYNRRIDRPGYQDLNPFLFFLDKYTYVVGNPLLNPQYTNAAALTYTFKDKYLATFSYGVTNDAILEILSQDDVTKATIDTRRNLGNLYSYTLSFIAPVDITPWWTTSNSLNFYHNEYQIRDSSTNLNNGRLSFDVTSTHLFTLPYGFKLEVSGFYNSPFVSGVFKGKSQFIADLGLQKSIWNKKGSLNLTYRDIFHNDRFFGSAVYNNINMNIRNTWETGIVSFSFIYHFGRNEIRAARERSGGNKEEQGRVKSN